MLSHLLPWLAIILVFGVLIFVHELGHFLAAKATGVYAPRFSIGFGPALWSRKWGETEYVLASIPLGGYVRLASRDDDASSMLEGGTEQPASASADSGEPLPKWYDPEALAPFGPKPVPPERLLESKSLPARLVIMLAGVTMNMLLGYVIIVGLGLSQGLPIIRTRVIGDVRDVPGAPALAQQLRAGDTISAVDGRPVATWNDVADRIDSSAGASLAITTQRGTVRIPLGRAGASTDSLLDAIQPFRPPIIGQLVATMPAAQSGLRTGDSVVVVGGDSVHSWVDMQRVIERAPGRPLAFTVVRDGAPIHLVIRPDSTPADLTNPASPHTTGRIGIQPVAAERVPIPVGTALVDAWHATWELAGSVVTALHQLAVGALSVRSLSGPVGIGRASYTAAQAGWVSILSLIAFLSINLAVFNLLPLPILDGGQILINVAESVKGSALSPRTREYLMRFGLAAIALLFVIVMYNDITSLVKNLFGI